MRRIYISAVVALLVSLFSGTNVRAQVLDFGGTVLNNDIASWSDLYDLSHTTHSYGTARSMAMGNAFTALGADMVSASLNPAGVGMYLSDDMSFTPMINVAKSDSSGQALYIANDGAKSSSTNFIVPNFGVVLPVYKGVGIFTNINFALSYNRIADFNQSRLMASMGHNYESSLANYFRLFSDAFLDDPTFDKDDQLEYDDPFLWGATLANRTDLTNYKEGVWSNDTIYDGVVVDQYSWLETLGAVDEWSFAGGFNIIDKLYFGISIGLQSINYTRNTYYGEDYSYAVGDTGNENQLLDTKYWQSTYYYGSGYNFKFGVTARPVHWLRIGVANHTPTYYSLEIGYAGAMQTETSHIEPGSSTEDIIPNYQESPYFEEYGMNAWQYHTPSRLLTGVSVTLGNRAILSADYERSWYQGMRLTNCSTIRGLEELYNGYFSDLFKANNTLRLGVECYVLPNIALRAGYIWSDSAIKSAYERAMTSRPSPTTQSFITAGLGFHLNKSTYLDLAYQYGTTYYTSIQPFYVTETYDDQTVAYIDSAIFDTKTTQQRFVLTLGFRF